LGRRNEEDRERPNPFITPSPPVSNADDETFTTNSGQAKTPLLLKTVSGRAGISGGWS